MAARIVRNLCIDELRRNRLPTTELSDGDRAGAGEDVYSTLSRRHELRRLIEDLADLPEQQRAALLMRELDGLSHDEVADALEISPPPRGSWSSARGPGWSPPPRRVTPTAPRSATSC